MNTVITICFCIFSLNQVDAFDLTVHINRLQGNSFIPVTVNLLDDDFSSDFAPSQYEIIFTRDVDKEHDMPLKFTYFLDSGQPLNSKPGSLKYTSLCESDKKSIEGHTAKMSARVLGIKNDPACPIKNGTRFIQDDTFKVDFDDYHMMLFNPLGPGYDAYLTVETENYFLYDIFTTYAEED